MPSIQDVDRVLWYIAWHPTGGPTRALEILIERIDKALRPVRQPAFPFLSPEARECLENFGKRFWDEELDLEKQQNDMARNPKPKVIYETPAEAEKSLDDCFVKIEGAWRRRWRKVLGF